MTDIETQLRALADHRQAQVPERPPTDADELQPLPASGDSGWLADHMKPLFLVAAALVAVAGIVLPVIIAQRDDDQVATTTVGGTMGERQVVDRADWASPLDADGSAGTFALAKIGDESQTIDVAVSDRAGTRFLPASTFKLLNALIILESGALPDLDTVVPWDGVTREISSWNQDHTLRTALQESAVWVFQQLATDVGAERMAELVAAAGYGNADTGGSVDSFWLDGDLRVSAIDQLAFLEQLVLGQLPFDPGNQAMVVASLPRLDGPDSRISYKTGTALAGEPPLAWLVGVVDTAEGQWVFAYNVDLRLVDGEPQVVSTQERLAVVVELLVSAGIIDG